MGGKIEWVEIVEPRSRDRMFVNLVTGECGWEEPVGAVSIKRLGEQDGEHQWWELIDVKTNRYYYYNATTQQTCWQKPKNSNSIIIPLAKFQLMKQQSQNGSVTGNESRGDLKDVACQTRDTCSVLVNNSTQTTPPPSLRRNMVHNYNNELHGGDVATGSLMKKSLRNYLINEALSARGLEGLHQDDCISDFDDDLWQSDDDYDDDEASSTSDHWDADDEIDHDDDNDDDEDEDEEDIEPVVGRQKKPEQETDREYETESDDHNRTSGRESADNQSFGSTSHYADESFVFVAPEPASSTWTKQKYSVPDSGLNGKSLDLHYSRTVDSRYPAPPPKPFRSERHYPSPASTIETPSPASSEKLRKRSLRSIESNSRPQVPPPAPPHQVPVPPQRGFSLSSFENSLSKATPPSTLHSDRSSLDRDPDRKSSFASIGKSSSRTRDISTDKTEKTVGDKKVKEKKSSPSKSSEKLSSSISNNKQDHGTSASLNQQIMEKFARENVARHIKRGVGNQLLKRKTSLKAMLTFSKKSIKQPMIATLIGANVSSACRTEIKNEAITCFKLIQQFMGDRMTVPDRKDLLPVSKESVAFDLITRACQRHELRDEIYVQLCRQTTDNPRTSSLVAGFELMACCLSYFPPSIKFSPYLASFLANSPLKDFEIPENQEVISLMNHCYKLLSKVRGANMEQGSISGCGSGTIYCRKPVTPKELEMVGDAIDRRFTGIFGESIDALMELQRNRWPEKRLPWILTTLCKAISRMGGAGIEGIFRIAADADELSFIKLVIDCINFDLLDDDGDILELLNHNSDEPVDVHVFACLLKQWFRSLREPIIPSELYSHCLEVAGDYREATSIILTRIPVANKLIVSYLIRFLQIFSSPENSNATKMDDSNLATIWAPNLLRSPQSNPMTIHPSVIYENTRKEMTFIRTLIQSLDTSFVEGID